MGARSSWTLSFADPPIDVAKGRRACSGKSKGKIVGLVGVGLIVDGLFDTTIVSPGTQLAGSLGSRSDLGQFRFPPFNLRHYPSGGPA